MVSYINITHKILIAIQESYINITNWKLLAIFGYINVTK
jgi:hypothetical protein